CVRTYYRGYFDFW
nr:immunoglobulin heavy chain junction region [Mus musculus]MBK4195819.1 immunoglobulin heavy chain junction region [Mus musculus]